MIHASSKIIKPDGLTTPQAQALFQKYGPNELPSQKRQSFLKLFWEVIKEPMLLLLIGSGVLYLFLGDLADALMLLFFVNVIVGITVIQERNTERSLYALRNLASPRALVIRDGKHIRIAGRDVVPGDVLVLREGDRVPADATLHECSHLLVDESLLTGESLAVQKTIWDGSQVVTRPGGDNLPFVYSGTLILSGKGLARVIATGGHSEIGKIGKALEGLADEKTPLTIETAKLIRQFSVLALGVCALTIGLLGFGQGQWTQGILAGLSLAMSMLPEEFSVVLLIFFSMGALRLSRVGVLTRKTSAIETLGAATVLCVDKTGTITQNRMQLTQLFLDGESWTVSDAEKISPRHQELLEYAVLASHQDPFDPMEKEIRANFQKLIPGRESFYSQWVLRQEYPLSKDFLAVTHVWAPAAVGDLVIACKGAPEAIAGLCRFGEAQLKALKTEINQRAASGLRLIGVAKARFSGQTFPSHPQDFDFEFLGILGFRDPVREKVPAALQECYSAGLKVMMITGDHPGTACHIAAQIGFKNPEQFVTGPELAQMPMLQIQEKVRTISVFARMLPEQKLALMQALKANGEIVAMTGDGVNDAPALKAAHIGIAMGQRGTDVAREAGKLVLLDDDFSSLVAGIHMGRQIDANLKKSVSFIIAVHVLIAGTALLPVILKLPLILFPAHIAFLELIIDPACSIVFEKEAPDRNLMQKPPRKISEPLVSRLAFLKSLMQGFAVWAVIVLLFLSVSYASKDEYLTRMITFSALVIGNLGLIFINLKHRNFENRALWWVTGLALVFLILITLFPPLQGLFHFRAG